MSLLLLLAACSSDKFALTHGDAGELDGSAGADGGACAADTCSSSDPSCHAYDFASGCPGDLSFGGDTTGVTAECTGGQLHIAAKDTLDVIAIVDTTTPGAASVARISAAVAVKDWDGGPMLTVALSGQPLAEVRTVIAASGNPRFSLCVPNGSCAAETFDARLGVADRLVLEISDKQTTFSVGCQTVATLPTSTGTTGLPSKATLELTFGKIDGNPIDGTLDDLVFAFR